MRLYMHDTATSNTYLTTGCSTSINLQKLSSRSHHTTCVLQLKLADRHMHAIRKMCA